MGKLLIHRFCNFRRLICYKFDFRFRCDLCLTEKSRYPKLRSPFLEKLFAFCNEQSWISLIYPYVGQNARLIQVVRGALGRGEALHPAFARLRTEICSAPRVSNFIMFPKIYFSSSRNSLSVNMLWHVAILKIECCWIARFATVK